MQFYIHFYNYTLSVTSFAESKQQLQRETNLISTMCQHYSIEVKNKKAIFFFGTESVRTNIVVKDQIVKGFKLSRMQKFLMNTIAIEKIKLVGLCQCFLWRMYNSERPKN